MCVFAPLGLFQPFLFILGFTKTQIWFDNGCESAANLQVMGYQKQKCIKH